MHKSVGTAKGKLLVISIAIGVPVALWYLGFYFGVLIGELIKVYTPN